VIQLHGSDFSNRVTGLEWPNYLPVKETVETVQVFAFTLTPG